MNYKGFKKIHDDDEKAVLKSHHGHEITISKKALHPDHAKKLSELPIHAAKGYPKPQNASFDDFVPGKDYKDEPLPGDQNASFMPQQHNFMDQEAMHPSPIQDFMTPGMGRVNQINGLLQDQNAYPQGSEARTKLEEELKKYPEATDYIARQAPVPASTQQPENATDLGSVGEAQPTDAQFPAQETDRQPSEAGAEQVQPLNKVPQVQVTPGEQFLDQITKWGNDLQNNVIHPKTYGEIASQHSLGKIGTMFGLLIGGAGAGLSHQPNALLKMMDDEIGRDLDAQKSNQSNKLHLGQLLEQHIINQGQLAHTQADINHLATVDAPLRDKMKQAYLRRLQLDQLYKKVVEPLPQGSEARKQAENAYGMVVQGANAEDVSAAAFANGRYNLYKNQLDDTEGGSSGGGGGPVNYNRFNQLQRANQMKAFGAPSDADLGHMTEEAKGLEEASALRRDFEATFNELDKKFLAGTLSPNDRKNAVDSLKGKMAKIAEGRFSGQSASLIEAMLPQPGDWGKTRANKTARDARFFEILSAGTPTLKRFHALNQTQSGFSRQQQPQQQYKTVNGVKYMRGPKGEAIPVK